MTGHPAAAYFIGGAPRTGKTTLARRISQRTKLQSTNTDAVRSELRRSILQTTEPDLYYLDSLNASESNMARLMLDQTNDIIAAADRESKVVWKTVEAFVRTNVKAGHDILVEGVAVLPEFIAKLDIPYSAVFLGNQSTGHAQIILEYAKTHPGTWLSKLSPSTIEAFAHFSNATSVHIEAECKKYGLTYIDMDEKTYERQLTFALSHLKQSPNRTN